MRNKLESQNDKVIIFDMFERNKEETAGSILTLLYWHQLTSITAIYWPNCRTSLSEVVVAMEPGDWLFILLSQRPIEGKKILIVLHCNFYKDIWGSKEDWAQG